MSGRRVASLVSVLLAAAVLWLSVWRHVDEQTYAELVSPGVQSALEAGDLDGVDEGREQELSQDDVFLPGELGYYGRVVVDRVRLWWLTDDYDEIWWRLEYARERLVMVQELVVRGQLSLALRTANKGTYYLQDSVLMLKDSSLADEVKVRLWKEAYKRGVEYEGYLNSMKEEEGSELIESSLEELHERVRLIQEKVVEKVGISE